MGSLRGLLYRRNTPPFKVLDLECLHTAFVNKLEVALKTKTNQPIVYDLSLFSDFKFETLPWFILAYDYYKRAHPNRTFQVRFPHFATDEYQFLSMWHFDHIIKRTFGDVRVPQQHGRVVEVDPKYRDHLKENKLQHFLLHHNLGQLRQLTELPHDSKVSADICGKVRGEFIEAGLSNPGIGHLLQQEYNIHEDSARLIATCIINEAVLLVHQHQEEYASLAFTIMGVQKDRLVFVTADNGKPIPEIFYPWYAKIKKLGRFHNYKKMTYIDKANILNYMIREKVPLSAVESSPNDKSLDLWAQLSYICRDTLREGYLGELTIVSDGVLARFFPKSGDIRSAYQEANFPWQGNLLKVSIPLRRRK
jgi:hypothetical protein